MSQEEVFDEQKAEVPLAACRYISTGDRDKEDKEKKMATPKKKVVLVNNKEAALVSRGDKTTGDSKEKGVEKIAVSKG